MSPQPQGVYPRLEGLLPDLAVKAVRTAYDYIFQLSTRLSADEGRITVLENTPAFRYRQAWLATAQYTQGDAVTHALGLWFALKNSVNVTPGTDATTWFLMVQGV